MAYTIQQLDLKLDIIRDFAELAEANFTQETQGYYDNGIYQQDNTKRIGISIKERHKISLRTVYLELNALVESQMYSSIEGTWLHFDDGKPKPKLPLEGGRTIEISKVQKYRFVSDMKYEEVVKFMNEHFNIRLEQIEGYDEFSQIRKIANSLKHVRGLRKIKDISDLSDEIINHKFWPYYVVEFNGALKAIRDVHTFLHALYKVLPQDSENR